TGDTPETLLRRAASARGEEAALLRFQAAELLLAEGEAQAALAQLERIDADPSLPLPLRADIRLLRAAAAGDNGQPALMLSLLDPADLPDLDLLDTSYRVRFHRLRAQAHAASSDPLESARERMLLDRYLSEAGQESNH